MTDEKSVVVDTNVWAVAEGMNDGATDQCFSACVALLEQVDGGLVLAVDTEDRILAEYLSTLRSAGTAGLAVKLAERLWRTRWNPAVCRPVPITDHDTPPGSFAEVPVALRDFDVDDQKFLAVAHAHGETPPLFQALDREWWNRRTDLAAGGLDVQFLCAPDLIAAGPA